MARRRREEAGRRGRAAGSTDPEQEPVTAGVNAFLTGLEALLDEPADLTPGDIKMVEDVLAAVRSDGGDRAIEPEQPGGGSDRSEVQDRSQPEEP